jgi:hypothetical protein
MLLLVPSQFVYEFNRLALENVTTIHIASNRINTLQITNPCYSFEHTPIPKL